MDGMELGMERRKAELGAEEKGARISRVDERVAAGYEGAFRGN
jgi:hypothetical protein